jgi:hypothetical protein
MTCRGQSLLHSCFRVHEGPAGHPGRRRLAAAETCQRALRNHPSWESDGDAKRAFGPVMSKWLASGPVRVSSSMSRGTTVVLEHGTTGCQLCCNPVARRSCITAPWARRPCTQQVVLRLRSHVHLRGSAGGGGAVHSAAGRGARLRRLGPAALEQLPPLHGQWSYRTRITWRFGPGAAASGGWSSGRSWCPGARAGPTRCRGGTRWSGPDQLARRPPAEVAATRSCAAGDGGCRVQVRCDSARSDTLLPFSPATRPPPARLAVSAGPWPVSSPG